MSTIMPQSELLRRAVAYIAEQQEDHPGTKIVRLVDDAAMRFNLSPKDVEALMRLFSDIGGAAAPQP